MKYLEGIVKWFYSRGKEASSWLAVVVWLREIGFAIPMDLENGIVQMGVGLACIVAFYLKDKVS